MSALFLPNSAWVPVTTQQRLRAPKILWTGPDAGAGFDPGNVYCCPTDYEPAGTYTDETRLGWQTGTVASVSAMPVAAGGARLPLTARTKVLASALGGPQYGTSATRPAHDAYGYRR